MNNQEITVVYKWIAKQGKADELKAIYAEVGKQMQETEPNALRVQCFFDEASFGVFNISDHKPGGIAAPIVMHIGSLQANLALRYLAGLPVSKDLLYYLYFDAEGVLVTQRFGMPVK